MNQSERNELQRALSDREETVMEMVGHSFHGRARWLTVISWVKMAFFVIAAAFAAVQFLRADAVRSQIAWASLFIVFALGNGIMFVLYWLELNRNAITRELKRLQLQLAEQP